MGELSRYILKRYYKEVMDPESSYDGYQELVHVRGLVRQNAIFCWFRGDERRRTWEKP